MPLKLLIIAHLLADFIFQPKKLIEWKKRNMLGILVHVMIFALLALLMMMPYLMHWETWAVIGGISLVHLLTDKIKIAALMRYKGFALPFILDQAIHLASILIGSRFIPEISTSGLSNNLYIFFLGVIYAIYIFFILFLQKSKTKGLIKVKIAAFTLTFAAFFAIAILM